MLCCVGLIGGMAVGQSLGGPWTYIAPAAGFGIGLVADMKFMHGTSKNADEKNIGIQVKIDAEPDRAMEVDESKVQYQVPPLSSERN